MKRQQLNPSVEIVLVALWLLQIRLQVLLSTVQSDANSVLKGSKFEVTTVFSTKILTNISFFSKLVLFEL